MKRLFTTDGVQEIMERGARADAGNAGETLDLAFLNTRLRLELAGEAAAAARPILRFFRFWLGAPAAVPDYTIRIDRYDRVQADRIRAAPNARNIVIRESSAAPFNLKATILVEGSRCVFANDHTVLDAPLSCERSREFSLRISGGSLVQAIEFLRDLVVRHEESLGTLILHAAAAERDGVGIAIGGRKGAGKTTTLFALTKSRHWRYFSGDKLFVVPRTGRVFAYAWRDFPFVGIGTMQRMGMSPELVERLGGPTPSSRSSEHKVLLDPDQFEEWMGSAMSPKPAELRCVVLPSVRPNEGLRVRGLTNPDAIWGRLNGILERSVDTSFFGWQSYLVPDYAPLFGNLSAARPVMEALTWIEASGDLGPELEQRVVELAKL